MEKELTVSELIARLEKFDGDLIVMKRVGLKHISPIHMPEEVGVHPSKECNPTYYGSFEEVVPNHVTEDTQKAVKI